MSVFHYSISWEPKGAPPMPPPQKNKPLLRPYWGKPMVNSPNISTSWEAQSHIYASASMLRSAVSFCCASLMSQQNLDQKKQMVCGQLGASLKRFKFQVDAIADVWCNMYMSSYDSPMFGLRHSFRFWWKLKKMALNVRNFLFSWVQFHLLNGWLSGSFKLLESCVT